MEERQNDPWDSLVLSIPDDVLAGMRRQLVRESNVKKCIYINDLTKDGFVDENGDILCRLPDGYITFWVKYRPRDDGSFLILTYQDGKIVDQRRTKPLLVEKPDLSRPTVIKDNGQEEYQTKLVPKKPLFGDIV
jgi:hypothetical protein